MITWPAQCDSRVGDSCVVSDRGMYVCTDGRTVRKHHPKVQFCPSLYKYPVVAARATRAPMAWQLATHCPTNPSRRRHRGTFTGAAPSVVSEVAASVRGMYAASPTRESHCAGLRFVGTVTIRLATPNKWYLAHSLPAGAGARQAMAPPWPRCTPLLRQPIFSCPSAPYS